MALRLNFTNLQRIRLVLFHGRKKSNSCSETQEKNEQVTSPIIEKKILIGSFKKKSEKPKNAALGYKMSW